MIFHLNLLPGNKISEPQIAAKLSLSRTPVHNALLQLSAEGLVRIEPNKGATVMDFSDSEISDIGIVRLAQDILSAELTSYYGRAIDFDILDELANNCKEAASRGDVYMRIKSDNDLHLKIAEMSNNIFLYRQQYALYQQIHLIHISRYTNIQDSLLQIHHHVPLVQAIRQRDISSIRNLLCTHLKDFYKINDFMLKNFK